MYLFNYVILFLLEIRLERKLKYTWKNIQNDVSVLYHKGYLTGFFIKENRSTDKSSEGLKSLR